MIFRFLFTFVDVWSIIELRYTIPSNNGYYNKVPRNAVNLKALIPSEVNTLGGIIFLETFIEANTIKTSNPSMVLEERNLYGRNQAVKHKKQSS